MNDRCCKIEKTLRPRFARAGLCAALPGILAIFMPKCPACFPLYGLVLGALGISLQIGYDWYPWITYLLYAPAIFLIGKKIIWKKIKT